MAIFVCRLGSVMMVNLVTSDPVPAVVLIATFRANSDLGICYRRPGLTEVLLGNVTYVMLCNNASEVSCCQSGTCHVQTSMKST